MCLRAERGWETSGGGAVTHRWERKEMGTVRGRQGPLQKGAGAGGTGRQRDGGRYGYRATAIGDQTRAGQTGDMEVGAGCPQRGSPSLTQPLHPPHPQIRGRGASHHGGCSGRVCLCRLPPPLSPPFFLSPHLIPVRAWGRPHLCLSFADSTI